MPEVVYLGKELYVYKKKSSIQEAASALRKAADMLESGSVTYDGASVDVGDHVHLEIELEESTSFANTYELELEFKWST